MPTTADFLASSDIRVNLAIMSLLWLTINFNYYLIKFLVNMFRQVYLTGLLSSLSGLVAYWHGGILYR